MSNDIIGVKAISKPCGACWGTGKYANGWECGHCHGKGKIKVVRFVRISDIQILKEKYFGVKK